MTPQVLVVPWHYADVLREHRVDLDRDIDEQFPEDADLPEDHWLAAGLSPLSFLETKHRDYVDGLLGVYEMNDVSLALNVFVESYMTTVSRYWLPTV